MGTGGGQTGAGTTTLSGRRAAGTTTAPPAADIRLLAVAFLAGLLLLHCMPALPHPLSLLPLLLLALLRFPGRTLYLSLVLALVWGTLQGRLVQADRLPESAHGDIRWLQGHVAGLPERSGRRLRFEFETTSTPERIRVSWYGDAPALTPGECWRLKLRLAAPRGSANPGGFDYEAWLWRKRISATAYVRDARPCADNRATLDSLRLQLSGRLAAVLQEQASAGVIRGLLLGDRNGIDDDQWAVFRQTGTSHLVAISGLHIGLMASVGYPLVFWLCRWLPGMQKFSGRFPPLLMAATGSVLVAGLYAGLSGFALPAQRAFIAVFVVGLALLLRRNIAPGQLLALALLTVLLLDPFSLLAPGFWLSFGAVGWILYLLGSRIGSVGRWRRLLWLQPALVLGLAPLTLYWFGEASVFAPLLNALLIPLFALLLPLLFAAALLSLLLPGIGLPCLIFLASLMDDGLGALEYVASLPGAYLQLPQPQLWEVALASASLLILLAPRGLPFRRVAIIGLLPLLLGPQRPDTGAFRLTLIDVGQGLSVLVQTRSHTLLFDAGPRFPGGFDTGEAIVRPLLAGRGIRRLDGFVQSHGDIDHRGGAEAVIAASRPELILGRPGHPPCHAGQSWVWDQVKFLMLHPGEQAWEGNNASCVLKISGHAGSALLTGDIEQGAEDHLLAVRKHALASNVLVVAHHGSATSSGEAFIDAVGPDYALVAAGWRNRWDFPREVVVSRFAERNIPLLSTGDHGAIDVWLRPDRPMKPVPLRQTQPRFWRAGR